MLVLHNKETALGKSLWTVRLYDCASLGDPSKFSYIMDSTYANVVDLWAGSTPIIIVSKTGSGPYLKF